MVFMVFDVVLSILSFIYLLIYLLFPKQELLGFSIHSTTGPLSTCFEELTDPQ